MRVFLALPLPREPLADLQQALPELPAGARPVTADRLHITLAFYGDLPDRAVPRLVTRLTRAAGRTAPMWLRLAGAGTFPRHARAARLLWVGVGGDGSRLARAAASAAAAGRRVGADVDDRRFRPHVTVARSRGELDWSRVVGGLEGYHGPEWLAGGYTLFASELGPTPRYQTLADIAWRAPPAEGQESRSTT